MHCRCSSDVQRVMTVTGILWNDPCGMKFTTLAGSVGGGAVTPGFVGHSKYNITQRKWLVGDGGLKRLVWIPKILKRRLESG